MKYRISQEASLKTNLSAKQTQRIMQTAEMQQALKLLQLPVLELSAYLLEEQELNPLLTLEEAVQHDEEIVEIQEELGDRKEMDFESEDFGLFAQIDDEFSDLLHDAVPFKKTQDSEKLATYLESSIVEVPSLQELLMKQARETFDTSEGLKLAEWLIGYVDEYGYITTPLKEIAEAINVKTSLLEKTLKILQTFDPPGICASHLKEALLIQLKRKNKIGGLAWQIINLHWNDLLQNYIPVIAKKLKVTSQEVTDEIEEVISKLDNHPGLSCSKKPTPYIIPDLFIKESDEGLQIVLNNDPLPPLIINRHYLRLLHQEGLPTETKKFIEEKIQSAKWLMRTVSERASTLERICQVLIKIDRPFFTEPEGRIKPLTMKKVAEALELHESTIARAVQGKYVQTSRGIVALRSFFTSGFSGHGEEISSKTIKEIIKESIEKEDKKNPLSDETLTQILEGKGIKCARRTVAKFRALLNIGNRHQRRRY